MTHLTHDALESMVLRLAGRLFLGDHDAAPYSTRNVARMAHEEASRRAALFTEHGATVDYRPLAAYAERVLAGFNAICPPV